MRWENLERGGEPQPRLALAGESTVRTFDAPEALGIRFHEVEARSAINQVPKRSRMPFRYTINPFRGCTHACTYCVHGDTRVLMASGRTKPIREIGVGDEICGTAAQGRYRRYVTTHVLAHWETFKKAYRVTLEDGTELVASGDHRFLTERGWKYVAGAQRGRWRRPHLTTNNKLLGTGMPPLPPAPCEDYRRGYLCGLVRGDGTLGSYTYVRRGRPAHIHAFRLALADFEALRRAQIYLEAFDVSVANRAFAAVYAGGSARPMRALATGARSSVDGVRALIRWPWSPGDAWWKGFLAGIFDAEGSNSGTIRISNTDPELIDRVVAGMRRFGFDIVVEDRRRENGLRCVRLRGGLVARTRFLQLVDPAITRKRVIAGTAVKGNAPLGVAEIRPLTNTTRLYDITTGTGDFIANGVVSHNCFARPTHTYLDLNAREDFEREIVVKVNLPELVRKELARPSWRRAHVALGTNTDPYQWVESRYRLTEGVWEAMRDFSNPCSVLTKSPLLLRDLKLFRELVERTSFTANLSIPTLEERAWRATEPHTPHPRKRIEAAGELIRNGIPTGVLIAPLMPGVNDEPRQVEEILERLGELGVTEVGGIGLHLRGEVREIWFDWLRSYRPDLVPRYEELFATGAYMRRDEADRLARLARGGARPRRWRVENADGEPDPVEVRPAAAEAQPTLF